MALRSLTAVLGFAMTLGLVGLSRAQDSTGPPAAAAETTKTKTQAKSTAHTTSKSRADQDHDTSSSSTPMATNERATFGAGCFWHVEDTFERLRGVNWAVSGYAGGNVPYPSYEMVHEGTTGHAEVVMVDFDPSVISYEKLLKVFWSCHDPTSINRQGPDIGPQYRSVIFYHNEEQKKAALESYRELTRAGVYRSPIVTQLVPMRAFYQAEDYHQDYYGGKPHAATRRHKTTVAKAKAKAKKPSRKAARSSPATRAAGNEPADSSAGPQP